MNKTLLKEQLIIHEGIRLKPYRDSVGKLTIGIGRNLDDVGISHEEALYLLNNDIEKALSQASAFSWFDKLSDTRQAVIVDMVFNLGLRGVRRFTKMIAAIEAEDFETAATEMKNSRWYRQVGKRGERLAGMMRNK